MDGVVIVKYSKVRYNNLSSREEGSLLLRL